MIGAYREIFLNDAQRSLGLAFDYAVNDCRVDIDLFAQLFASSTPGELFGQGDPRIISGTSGVELAREQLERLAYLGTLPEPAYQLERSPEYWTGWILAYYQWHSGLRFKDVLRIASASTIRDLYPLFHEMDPSCLAEELDARLSAIPRRSNLGEIRQSRGLSQAQLARAANVNIRSIQMYEQGCNDINKAQAITLYRLACVLGCTIEDLLENPTCEWGEAL